MINVIKLDNMPHTLTDQMAEFEKTFKYPLGDSGSFSISHGDDYSRFYRAMGRSNIYVARYEGKIAGTLAMVHRPIYLNGIKHNSLYIGDLKIKNRNGRLLYCLIKEAHDDNIEFRDSPQYGVMMKGTERRPSDYTGRLGLPKFKNMGEIAVIRVPVKYSKGSAPLEHISKHGAVALCEELVKHETFLPIGRSNIRSLNKAKAYCLPDKSAVCILEDTMSAKRLFADNGSEIISGHLSSFNYFRIEDGLKLVKSIMTQAAENSYPALFFSVPYEDKDLFLQNLEGAECAPAFVYGRNMEASKRWSLNTSEI